MKKELNLLLLSFAFCASASAQQSDWLHKDLKSDAIFGISSAKAYTELLKGKKPKPVIVAVIDAGVDYKHEDLKDVIWKNKKEIGGNGKDEDKNGYADDVYGWNFLGSERGSVRYDNTELARIVKKSPSSVLKNQLDNKVDQARKSLANAVEFGQTLTKILAVMTEASPDSAAFKDFKSENEQETFVARRMFENLSKGASVAQLQESIATSIKHYEDKLKYALNVDYNSREIVGDNLKDLNERFYGNFAVDAVDCEHGTHVAGIIAAKRANNLGIDGVADAVLIMPVRAVPDGDERDKDVANAIYYAVNNGAKIINMSFGKGYSPEKVAVDKAVKYAASKDVLFVHAAGNDAKNVDVEDNFPKSSYLDGGNDTDSWLVVGASGWKDDESLSASFSNYGAKTVDVFAPGVGINSTIPGSKYRLLQGTSMAAPVVSGIAALIREYYPSLSAKQVKEILLKSVTKVTHKVRKPGTQELVDFTELCVSGGIVNSYHALLLADRYSKGATSR